MAPANVRLPPNRKAKLPGHYLEIRKRFNEQGVVKRNHAPSTTVTLQGVQRKWSRYCEGNNENPLHALHACTKADCMTFLVWILDNCRVQKKNSLCQYWKVFRMIHRKSTGQDMNKNAVEEVNHFIDGSLRQDYALDLSRREKPVLHVNDLLLVLRHHWLHDTEIFPDERQRVQLAALLLTAAYTGARPGSLVYIDLREQKSRTGDLIHNIGEHGRMLCYKHITLLMLGNDDPQERDVMVMEIDLTHVKGDLTTSKPKKFLFHEHDLLAFCPIAHIIALALADDAFESRIACDVAHLFHAEASPDRLATPLLFKSSMRDVPIFRQATSTASGYRTSSHKALRYHTFNNYLQRLGRGTGFQQILTAYCVRRGTGNALDGVATEAVRNQIMGHQSSRTFQYYLNERVKFDVQAAFLGSPSRQAVIAALGSMGRSLDCRAPTKLTREQRAALKSDVTITGLCALRDRLSIKIKKECGFRTIRDAEGTEIHKQYTSAQNALSAARTYCAMSTLKNVREHYFRTIDTKELDEQFERLPKSLIVAHDDMAKSVEGKLKGRPRRSELMAPISPIQHRFAERARVAELLFEDTSTLSMTQKLACRMEAITNMTALCNLREMRRHKTSATPDLSSPADQETQAPTISSKICPDRQCFFCLGDSALPIENRFFEFSCSPAAKRHMRAQHLARLDPEVTLHCPHPLCEGLPELPHIRQLKIHAASVHNVNL